MKAHLCVAVYQPTAISMFVAKSTGMISAVALESPFIMRRTPFPIYKINHFY